LKNIAAVIVCVLDIIEALGKKQLSRLVERLIVVSAASILLVTGFAFLLAACYLAISRPLGPTFAALLTGGGLVVAGIVALRIRR